MHPDVGRVAGRVAPVAAAAAALVVHALAAARLDGRAPTDGEARLVAAVFAARGGPVGPVSLPFSDLLAARQLAAVTALVPASSPSVYETVRMGGLLLGVVTAVLLWALVRRLGGSDPASAVAIAIVGVTPPAVALHSGVTAAAVGVPWLLLAALLCSPGWVRSVAAASAAVVAVLTVPLLGAVLLAFAASWLADRGIGATTNHRHGVGLGLGLGVAAVALAVAASGSGPLAGAAGPLLTTPVAVVGAVAGAGVVAAGWRVRWVRPLLAPAGLLLAVLLVPGPGRSAAASTVVPLLAVIVAALADDLDARLPRVRALLWAGAGVAVVAAALTAVLPAGRPLPDPAPASLSAWLDDQLAPGARLHADALDRTELVSAGFPVDRLRALDDAVRGTDVVLLTDRSGGGAVAPHCAATTVLITLPRWGGGPAEICGGGAAADTDDPADRASRIRIGTALAGNPALRLDPQAADLLTTGQVDPRVMIVLAALASSHTVDVAEFPPAALEPPGGPRRRVVVTAVDDQAASTDGPLALHGWLGRQQAPFAPTVLRNDGVGLLVGYSGPPPAGLLPN